MQFPQDRQQTTVAAENLSPVYLDDFDTLADGAIVMGVSVQLNWVYAKVIKGGKVTTRRYRPGQQVALQQD